MKAAAANQQLSLLDDAEGAPRTHQTAQDAQNAPEPDNPADARKAAENASATWSDSLAQYFSWGHA